MVDAAPTRVLISYSHDSFEHGDRVRELADQLRNDGVEAIIDQYIQSPPEGWPAWCEAQIRKADFVPMVCTETYLRRVNGEEEPGKGRGVLWEARLIRQHLYDVGAVSSKFVPVLLANGLDAHVPVSIKGGTIYRVGSPEGYETLLRLLTGQPLTPMPPLGSPRYLPPRERRAANLRASTTLDIHFDETDPRCRTETKFNGISDVVFFRLVITNNTGRLQRACRGFGREVQRGDGSSAIRDNVQLTWATFSSPLPTRLDLTIGEEHNLDVFFIAANGTIGFATPNFIRPGSVPADFSNNTGITHSR